MEFYLYFAFSWGAYNLMYWAVELAHQNWIQCQTHFSWSYTRVEDLLACALSNKVKSHTDVDYEQYWCTFDRHPLYGSVINAELLYAAWPVYNPFVCLTLKNLVAWFSLIYDELLCFQKTSDQKWGAANRRGVTVLLQFQVD